MPTRAGATVPLGAAGDDEPHAAVLVHLCTDGGDAGDDRAGGVRLAERHLRPSRRSASASACVAASLVERGDPRDLRHPAGAEGEPPPGTAAGRGNEQGEQGGDASQRRRRRVGGSERCAASPYGVMVWVSCSARGRRVVGCPTGPVAPSGPPGGRAVGAGGGDRGRRGDDRAPDRADVELGGADSRRTRRSSTSSRRRPRGAGRGRGRCRARRGRRAPRGPTGPGWTGGAPSRARAGRRSRWASRPRRLAPRQQLEEHETGGVDVGAGVGDAALDLLGGEVGDGAHEGARGVGRRGRRDGAGQPEVGDLDQPVGRMRTFSGLTSRWIRPVAWAASRPAGARRAGRARAGRQRSLGRDELAQGAPGDVLHDEEQVAVVLALVVDRDDVRVPEPGRRAGLPAEAAGEGRSATRSRRGSLTATSRSRRSSTASQTRGHPAVGEVLEHAVAAVEQTPDDRLHARPGARRHGASLGRVAGETVQAGPRDPTRHTCHTLSPARGAISGGSDAGHEGGHVRDVGLRVVVHPLARTDASPW